MADAELKESHEEAAALIGKSKFDEALDLLREADASGKDAWTMKLAGDAKLGLARESELGKPVSLYRQSRKHYVDALKIDPGSKKTRNSYNALLNEMQNSGISETAIPPLIKDGTPTLLGLVVIPLMLIGVLAVVKVAAGGSLIEAGSTVELDMTWTNADGSAGSGTITIELYSDDAPIHVENFQALVEQGKFDGVSFHRIINGFMIQGGDFTQGTGTGGHAAEWFGYCNGQAQASADGCPQTSWTIPDEADNGRNHAPYSLAMAKTSAANTGGSQFYIVDGSGETVPPSHLDGIHTVFGEVTSGFNVVDAISDVPVGQNDAPNSPVTVEDARLIGGEEGGWLGWLTF